MDPVWSRATWGGGRRAQGSHTDDEGQTRRDEAAACGMAETGAAARHLGAGVARRAAHHARRAAERNERDQVGQYTVDVALARCGLALGCLGEAPRERRKFLSAVRTVVSRVIESQNTEDYTLHSTVLCSNRSLTKPIGIAYRYRYRA